MKTVYKIVWTNTVIGAIEGTELLTPMYKNVLKETTKEYKTYASAKAQLTRKGWSVENEMKEVAPFTMYIERIKEKVEARKENLQWEVKAYQVEE